MRTPKNIKTADLRTGILRTQAQVIERIQYLTECIDYNDLDGQPHCKENRQMLREIRQLIRYGRWLGRLWKEVCTVDDTRLTITHYTGYCRNYEEE